MSIYVVKTAPGDFAYYSPARQVARAPSGRLWTIYLISAADTDIAVAYSDDGGQTWTEEVVVSGLAGVSWDVTIAVDSSGRVGVAWTWGIEAQIWYVESDEDLLFGEWGGAVLYETYDVTPYTGQYANCLVYATGQTFTPSVAHTIDKFSFKGSKTGSPTGTASIKIYLADAAHKPTGNVLAQGNFDASSVVSGWNAVTLTQTAALSAGVEYVAVLEYTGGSGYDYINWWYKDPGGYSGGVLIAGVADSIDNYRVSFRSRSAGGVWDDAVVIHSDGQETYLYTPNLAVDGSDNWHLVWYGHPSSSTTNTVFYRKRTNGTWGDREEVAAEVDYGSVDPVIALDADSYVHVIWRRYGYYFGADPNYEGIWYRKKTTSWQAVEVVTENTASKVQTTRGVAADASGHIHVVWDGQGWGVNTTKDNVRYRKRTDSWQDGEAVTDVAYHQGYGYGNYLSLDTSGNVYVTWEGSGWGANPTKYTIQHKKRTGEGWQDREEVSNKAYHQCVLSTLWAYFPISSQPASGYSFVGRLGSNPDFCYGAPPFPFFIPRVIMII